MKYGANMKNVFVGVHDNDRSRGYHKRHSEVAEGVLKSKRLWVRKLNDRIPEQDLYLLWFKWFRSSC
jgi:hypothetical protein